VIAFTSENKVPSLNLQSILFWILQATEPKKINHFVIENSGDDIWQECELGTFCFHLVQLKIQFIVQH
jgi:hypothetical protein